MYELLVTLFRKNLENTLSTQKNVLFLSEFPVVYVQRNTHKWIIILLEHPPCPSI